MPECVIAKYIRLSLDDAQTDSMSIENQRLLLDRHISELGISQVIEFVDNGYSGTNFERPGIQELLELVRIGKVNCIAVKDFSRFGRNAIETGYFIERVFPLYNIRFISVSDGFDSADYKGDTGGLEVAFKFLMHEQYSRDLSKKIKSAKHEKMRRGEHVRKDCLYGYRLDEKRKMVIDAPAADTVRLIFALALEGNSIQQIAKRLYEEKRPTPGLYKGRTNHSGCIWQTSTIYTILHDEQYTGVYIAGRQKCADVGSKTILKQPESEWYRVINHHPAIIEKEQFDSVQALLSDKNKPKDKNATRAKQGHKQHDHPLKDKVFCGCCGHKMALSHTKNKMFQCRYTMAAVDQECHGCSISASELSKVLFELISRQAKVILNNSLDDLEALDEHSVVKSDLEALLQQYQSDMCSLYEKYVLGEVDAEFYKNESAGLKTEINRLTREMANLAANVQLKEAVSKVRGRRVLSSPLVDLLIEKVSVWPGERVEVLWKVSGFAC